MTDCWYVYEYRDPRSGNTIYVGSGQKLEAWLVADRAITGRSIMVWHNGEDAALHWFLRSLIENEHPISDLAPFIVGCYANQTLAKDEAKRRIKAYGGRSNLMNGSLTPYVPGVPPLPATTCGPGSFCDHQRLRVSHLETIPRQVGMFACYVPARFTGEVRGGRWNHYPIIHDRGFIAEMRREALQEQPEEDLREADDFLLEYATKGLARSLNKLTGEFSGERARKIAGVLRELLQRNFFVVEVNDDGRPIQYHDTRISASQFAMGEKVMRDIRKDVMRAMTRELPAIWEKVRDGTYIRVNGGNAADFDPNAPAMPPPNHIPYDSKRKPFKYYPPTPVAEKPSEDDPNLMGALARLAHLIEGGRPEPTNGVPISAEEALYQREMSELSAHHSSLPEVRSQTDQGTHSAPPGPHPSASG